VTHVTIVHYVVADNPPVETSAQATFTAASSTRRASGPGSHVTSPARRATARRRILNTLLYVGYETPTGPIVERYQLLR
jgi:hypothetical protein